MGAESLQAACELAYVIARQVAESDQGVEPPAGMRSFLYVEELPRRAIGLAREAVEEDSDFRERVAEHATESDVGRAGYLWLHRPNGWDQEFELLTSDSVQDSSLVEEAQALDHDFDRIGRRCFRSRSRP